MEHVTAVCSMLHEAPSHGANSATRLFREQPVLAWTASRLTRAQRIAAVVIICWEDQLDAVEPIACEQGLDVLNRGPRVAHAQLDSLAAARRWADGWRGGLMQTCDCDAGFHAASLLEIFERHTCDAVVLADPSAGLIDPILIDGLVAHAESHEAQELIFSQAAPGLAGVLLRPGLVERLAQAKTHPGKLLHYLPDAPAQDPIGGKACMPVAARIARTTHHLKLNSRRQIARITEAMIPLNGQLIRSQAEELVSRLSSTPMMDSLPREITLELNTARASCPIYSPVRIDGVRRPDISADTLGALFKEIGESDDIRLTLAGVGDPLLHPDVFNIIEAAKRFGIGSIHLETDLIGIDAERVKQLAASAIDVLTIHAPALAHETYTAIMGVDQYTRLLDNIRTLLIERANRNAGVPLVVPTFTKCAKNLNEMEPWYDQWLRAVGVAVIVGPTTFGGQLAETGVADMSPAKRRACSRLASRLTVLCDGSIVLCEQDVVGRHALGAVGKDSIADVWRHRFEPVRRQHEAGNLTQLALCGACTEWHRP